MTAVPRALRRAGGAAALALLLTGCLSHDFDGSWAPTADACAPGSPERITIGAETLDQVVPNHGPVTTFAVVRHERSDNGDRWLRIWFDLQEGPSTAIFRWTFQVLSDDQLRRVEVAIGAGAGYDPVESRPLDLVRCETGR